MLASVCIQMDVHLFIFFVCSFLCFVICSSFDMISKCLYNVHFLFYCCDLFLYYVTIQDFFHHYFFCNWLSRKTQTLCLHIIVVDYYTKITLSVFFTPDTLFCYF